MRETELGSAPRLPLTLLLGEQALLRDEGLRRGDARRQGLGARCLDERLDRGVYLLAQQGQEDGLLGATGIVGRGVNSEALEEVGVFVKDVEEVGRVVLEDARGGLNGLPGKG